MKKLLALLLALTMVLGLAACGSTPAETEGEEPTEGDTAETVTLTVAATPTPHAEILQQVVEPLKEEGVELVIKEYTDYILPNTAVEEGEMDANYFQHTPYMNDFNAKQGTHLVAVADIHFEPLGLYPGKTTSLEELPEGATVAVPNDSTNEGRALLLLEAQGLITLKEDAGLECTINDIVDNPKKLEIKELEAAMVPQVIDDVDVAIINSNYAIQADLDPTTDALVSESAEDAKYPNIICVKEGNENNEAILKLVEALKSDAVRTFIEENYNGAVVPMF